MINFQPLIITFYICTYHILNVLKLNTFVFKNLKLFVHKQILRRKKSSKERQYIDLHPTLISISAPGSSVFFFGKNPKNGQ